MLAQPLLSLRLRRAAAEEATPCARACKGVWRLLEPKRPGPKPGEVGSGEPGFKPSSSS